MLGLLSSEPWGRDGVQEGESHEFVREGFGTRQFQFFKKKNFKAIHHLLRFDDIVDPIQLNCTVTGGIERCSVQMAGLGLCTEETT
jgi:hypothetical protein